MGLLFSRVADVYDALEESEFSVRALYRKKPGWKDRGEYWLYPGNLLMRELWDELNHAVDSAGKGRYRPRHY